jgi:DNA-binding NarL/FixJ family response regulator
VTENAVRVLFANRQLLLREMVLSALSEHEEINVVGEVEDERDVPELMEKKQARLFADWNGGRLVK